MITIIEKPNIQNIVIPIVASLIGGFLTLLGVAWTIKDNNNTRIENDRLARLPLVVISQEEKQIKLTSILMCLNSIREGNLKTSATFTVDSFKIKVASSFGLIPLGMEIDNVFCKFDDIIFANSGTIIEIPPLVNVTYSRSYITLDLIISDIIGNLYRLECKMECINSMHTSQTEYDNLKVVRIGLPQLIEENLKSKYQI